MRKRKSVEPPRSYRGAQKPKKKHTLRNILIVFIVLLVIYSLATGGSSENKDEAATSSSTAEIATDESTASNTVVEDDKGEAADDSTTSNTVAEDDKDENANEETSDVEAVEEDKTDSNVAEDKETSSETASLGSAFDQALEAIGMDPGQVKKLKKLDDWASGERYRFVYNGYAYLAYILDNGEINSICNENQTVKIYERGYEPLNYKDFEPDSTILQGLLDIGISELSKYILNEETIRTKLGSTSFYRIYDYYSFNGDIVAKNKKDKETYTFTVDFLVNEDNDTAVCKYVSIDGKVYYGTQDGVVPEVKKVEISEPTNSADKAEAEVIVISDGKEGTCGQYDDFDGEQYLRYYVPAGKYEVTCVVRGGFYVESVELHEEDGWDTATTFAQYTMDSGDTETITIEEGQCISLILNTEIELKKIS